MYRIKKINTSQKCPQILMWSKNASEPPKSLCVIDTELLTVTYGTLSPTILVMHTIQQLLIDSEINFTKAVNVKLNLQDSYTKEKNCRQSPYLRSIVLVGSEYYEGQVIYAKILAFSYRLECMTAATMTAAEHKI